MNPHTPDAAGFTRREGLIALLGGVAALSGCGGGGGDVASVGSGGTGSFSSGVITGFGSVIVNGVRFDDSKARITDDEGASRSSADLKLGMVVTITASGVTASAAGSTATATTITFGSELRGAIESIGAGSIVVLGQTVQVTPTTVFDGGIAGGLAGLAAGQFVEVHGFLDPATNRLTATRIEREASAASLKLQGAVQSLDATARTFRIGTVTISYAGIPAPALPANLANGMLVQVLLAPSPATGTRTANAVRAVARSVDDHDEAEVEGTVTAFTTISSFSVDGVAVDASKAAFPDGSTALKLGARVEVTGRTSGGVLVATVVKVETESELASKEFELHGAVTDVNTAAKTFKVRGVTVSYAGTVKFEGGDASTLAAGAGALLQVEVKGTYDAATNSVAAVSISFER